MWEIGYVNLVMLMATIPVYDPEEEQVERIDFGDDVQSLSQFINNIK
jgi:hypothetical protein